MRFAHLKTNTRELESSLVFVYFSLRSKRYMSNIMRSSEVLSLSL